MTATYARVVVGGRKAVLPVKYFASDKFSVSVRFHGVSRIGNRLRCIRPPSAAIVFNVLLSLFLPLHHASVSCFRLLAMTTCDNQQIAVYPATFCCYSI